MSERDTETERPKQNPEMDAGGGPRRWGKLHTKDTLRKCVCCWCLLCVWCHFFLGSSFNARYVMLHLGYVQLILFSFFPISCNVDSHFKENIMPFILLGFFFVYEYRKWEHTHTHTPIHQYCATHSFTIIIKTKNTTHTTIMY